MPQKVRPNKEETAARSQLMAEERLGWGMWDGMEVGSSDGSTASGLFYQGSQPKFSLTTIQWWFS